MVVSGVRACQIWCKKKALRGLLSVSQFSCYKGGVLESQNSPHTNRTLKGCKVEQSIFTSIVQGCLVVWAAKRSSNNVGCCWHREFCKVNVYSVTECSAKC
eukprot:6455329-Amphidinium_carterae.1